MRRKVTSQEDDAAVLHAPDAERQDSKAQGTMDRRSATPGEPHQPPSVGWSTLMARAQDGDRVAYRRLLDEITPYLRSLVARHPSLAGALEDTVQDILLTVHAVRHTYDPRRPFGPWLLTIARRRIADQLRRRGRRAVMETALGPEHETIVAAGPNFYALLSGRSGLRAAIERLPAGQQQAVLLLKLRGLSLKEAASESGMSVGALKVASHRALKALRAMLDRRM